MQKLKKTRSRPELAFQKAHTAYYKVTRHVEAETPETPLPPSFKMAVTSTAVYPVPTPFATRLPMIVSNAITQDDCIDLPWWARSFRPRLPQDDLDSVWPSPIPKCRNITHALLVKEALLKFNFAVYLADEDAGESETRLQQSLVHIVSQYMPAMSKLRVGRHQIVFFFHGRGYLRLGCKLWDCIGEWEDEQRRSRELEARRLKEQEMMIMLGNQGYHGGREVVWPDAEYAEQAWCCRY